MTHWVEAGEASEYNSRRNFEFDYFLNVSDQTIYAEIELKSRKLRNEAGQKIIKGK